MRSVIKSAKTVDEAVEKGLRELGANKKDAVIEIIEQPSRGLFGLIGSKDAVVKVSIEDNFKEELLKDLRLPYVSREESPERMKKKPEPQQTVKEEKTKEPEKAEITEPVRQPIQVEKKKKEPKAEQRKEEIRNMASVAEPVIQEEDNKAKEITVAGEPEEEFTSTEIPVSDNPSAKLLRSMIEAMGLTASYSARQRGNILYLSAKEIPEDKAGLVIGRRGETLDAMQYLLTLSANRKELNYSKVILDINDYREKREDALKQLALRSAEKVKKTNKNMRLEPMNPYERRIIHAELQKVEGVHTVSEGNEPYRRVVIRINRNK